MYTNNGLPPDVQDGLRRATLAQQGGYGSVAARFDPNNYGSIESRAHPGLFGPYGALNPQYQQSAAQYMQPRAPYNPYDASVSQTYGLKRPSGQPMGMSPLMYQMMQGQRPQQQNDED